MTFTHVVELNFAVAVDDEGWRQSLTDDFIDHARWEAVKGATRLCFRDQLVERLPGFHGHR